MPGYLTPSELDLEHWRWVTERLCIRCKRPATRQTVIDVAVGPLAFCSALCEQLWGQAAAEREGWRS